MALVHRKNVVVSLFKAKEDGILETIHGQVFVGKDDIVCTNLDNEQFTVDEEYIKAMQVVEVKPVEKKTVSQGFAEMYMQQIKDMGSLEQEEDKDYIEGKQNGWTLTNDPLNETYNG